MRNASIERLESDLRALGRDLSYPETPDLAAAVMQRVARAPVSAPALPPSRFGFAMAAAVVAAIALIALVALSPVAREAVADWLGVDGVRITFDGKIPDEPLGDDLNLGVPVDARDAREAVEFDVGVPRALGEPSAYFLMRDVPGGEVSMVWGPAPGLPESEHTGVGAVLTQFPGDAAPESIKKTADPATTVTSVTIDGSPGFFIEGAPHLVVRDPGGGMRSLDPRLAGNTLLWDGGEVTYRLEAEVGLRRALEIARSLEY